MRTRLRSTLSHTRVPSRSTQGSSDRRAEAVSPRPSSSRCRCTSTSRSRLSESCRRRRCSRLSADILAYIFRENVRTDSFYSQTFYGIYRRWRRGREIEEGSILLGQYHQGGGVLTIGGEEKKSRASGVTESLDFPDPLSLLWVEKNSRTRTGKSFFFRPRYRKLYAFLGYTQRFLCKKLNCIIFSGTSLFQATLLHSFSCASSLSADSFCN